MLAANPRTARGFSGDLILDEFAFHEDSAAIWDAAEPILAANQDYLCRIASTGNGKYNLFYRMATCGRYKVWRVTRSDAWRAGVKIFDPMTRQPVTPEEAREAALDKAAYDQNYECAFADDNMTLLTHELISAAERDDVGFICEQDWSPEALERMRNPQGYLYMGVDVGRNRDLTVMTVIEFFNGVKTVRGILRIAGMRLPEQQERVGEICRLMRFHRACIDMTGIGLGLTEYSQKAYGYNRIRGINFSTKVPINENLRWEGHPGENVPVTEAMATTLLQTYEDRRIQHPRDGQLRDDLRKPEKVTSPGGRVSIAATRNEAGHADHFWSLALALEATRNVPQEFHFEVIKTRRRDDSSHRRIKGALI